MKFHLLFISLVFSVAALADQPPNWLDYVITSENKKWTALVSRDYATKNPWDDTWTLSIYKGFQYPFPRPDLKPVWSRSYEHSGYSEGLLSDDGRIFVYVEFWYRKNHPVIKIYKEDCKLKKNGSFFNAGEKLERAVLHKIWLKTSAKTEFTSINSEPYITVQTVAGDRHVQASCEQKT